MRVCEDRNRDDQKQNQKEKDSKIKALRAELSQLNRQISSGEIARSYADYHAQEKAKRECEAEYTEKKSEYERVCGQLDKYLKDNADVVIATDTYTDTLSYEQHLGTETYGRYPDGANDVYVMNVPTIAKMNKIGSYDTLYVKPIKPTPEPDAIRSYTKEGGITIAYVDGVVNIKSEDAAIRTANIYNMSGMKMTATSFTNANNQFVSINVATLMNAASNSS